MVTEILINECLRRLHFPVSLTLLAADSDLILLPVCPLLKSLSGVRVQGIRRKNPTFSSGKRLDNWDFN